MAQLSRISACLALLRPTLGEPIPQHLIGYFTVENLPGFPQRFEPDAEVLCGYCQSLTQLLSAKSLTGLLCELVWLFIADLKAPGWERKETEH